RCTGAGPLCAGRLALKRARAVWASRAFTMTKGRKVIRVRLRSYARRSLIRRGRATVTLEVRLKGQPVQRAPIGLRYR
ncbi:MAG: hypothetical protein M3389_12965, partial [Actinomycetota bacterium]|nr:hypothetical protein [Actinomycetota bacterium]